MGRISEKERKSPVKERSPLSRANLLEMALIAKHVPKGKEYLKSLAEYPEKLKPF